MKYIEPNFRLLDSVNDLKINYNEVLLSLSQTNSFLKFKDFYNHQYIVFLSDPGNGKSRVLKEIIKNANKYGKEGIYIDLKKIKKNISIKDYILEVQNDAKVITDNFENKYGLSLKTDYFKFEDDKKNIVCLDALDEVQNNQYEIIEKIEKFCNDCPNVSVYISCRSYIYEKYSILFNGLFPMLIDIKPLTHEQIKNYLTAESINETEINKIIKSFFKNGRIEVIDSPRVLEIFVSLFKTEGVDKVLSKSKAELLETFIYKKLYIEDEKFETNYKEIIKRVLETLALTMQINQKHVITKEELMSFFIDAKSNLSNSFLHQVKIDVFYDHSLLIPSDNTIKFENVEFQEYLAAKEIVRFGKADQVLYELIFDKELNEFYPFWNNTVKYVIDFDLTIHDKIIEFIYKRKNKLDASILNYCIRTEKKQLASVQDNIKEKNFKYIFEYYLECLKSFDYHIIFNLQHYYTDEIDKYLIDYYKEQKEEYQVNLILGIVKNLLSSELIADKNYWKNEALKLIKKYKSDNGIGIQMNCIEILSCFKNINLITENFNYEDLRDSLKNTFIEACVKVAPNDISVIKRTIDYYVNHDNYVRLENLFSNSKESKSIITILNNLISNREFRNKIGSDSQFTDSFLDNIKNVWDKKIEKLIIKLLVESHDFVFWDEFAKKFSCLLQEKNSNFIYNLIDEIIKNTGKSHQFDLINLLIELITLNNATQIAEIFIEKKQKEIGAKVFSWLNYNKSGFYEIGNRYFLDIYSKYHSNTIDKLEQVSFNPYKIFLENLKTKSGDIFRFYNTHKVKIKENISPAESTELKNLIVNIILKYDFSKASITQEGNTIYRADIIRYFEDALSLFEDLKIEQALYRKKIIEFFPFAFTNDDSKIFDLLPNLTSDEIDSIVEFYSTERTDDLLTVNIGKLFSFCRRYNTEKVLMLLKSFVLNDKIRGNDRIQSIEINNIIKPDKDFFNEVFNLYKDFSNETEKILAYRANEYLIYLNDSNAIKWRLNEIKTTTKDLGILHLPLTKVTDSSFSKDYLDLLEFATKLDSSKSGQVFSICGTVISYFDNLKIYKSTQYLKQLDDFISKYQDLKWIYNLTEGYNRIRVNYLNYACVPSSFSECIQKYNLLKEKQFLTVNSPETLWYIIQDAIDKDIRNWVENEGAYKVIKDLSEKGETLIQKTLKGQLELALIKRGFRPNELRIKREEQLLNDKKPDFTICYGFIGQILIEIKRNYIKDVNSGSEDYKSILEQYITGSSSNYGIFLIFQTDEENKLSKILPKLEKTYSGNHNIKIIGIDCLCEKQ